MITNTMKLKIRSDSTYLPLFSIFALPPQYENFHYVSPNLYFIFSCNMHDCFPIWLIYNLNRKNILIFFKTAFNCILYAIKRKKYKNILAMKLDW